jgi:hypothetical protein
LRELYSERYTGKRKEERGKKKEERRKRREERRGK